MALPDTICYEYPFSKTARLFLRFEQLMSRFDAYTQHLSLRETESSIQVLLDLFDLTSRVDLKGDVLREFDRLKVSLEKRLTAATETDERSLLEQQKQRLQELTSHVNRLGGQVVAHLVNHDFFNAIRQRNSIPGGLNSFDLPLYHYWLRLPLSQRQDELQKWIAPFEHLNVAVATVLALIRNNNPIEALCAEHGYYERALDTAAPVQMIRLWLPTDAACFPEISGGKHRLSIRFFEPLEFSKRPRQDESRIKFELMNCTL
ncbi:MAG: cell division protein ZapD [Thiotrichales bacterium]